MQVLGLDSCGQKQRNMLEQPLVYQPRPDLSNPGLRSVPVRVALPVLIQLMIPMASDDLLFVDRLQKANGE